MRTSLRWTLGFLAFPVAGLAGTAVAGPVATPTAALVGGAVTGLVIGAGQALAGRLDPRRWVPATVAGLATGLLLGSTAVGHGTTLPDLALMGLITGVPLGLAQALALPPGTRHRWAWAGAMPVLWALGWTTTVLAGVDVERQYTTFGATGALVFSLLSGLLLARLQASSSPSRYPAATAEARSRTSSLA